MPSWSGRVSPASTCCTACARSALSARVFEQGGGVGGTWYWNRYPGARCDVESLRVLLLVLARARAGMGLERALRRPARDPGLCPATSPTASTCGRDIEFETRVMAAEFDEATALERDAPTAASGRGALPDHGDRLPLQRAHARLPGARRFKGRSYHTGRWPHEGVDFTGQRVGVIGTGSSGIQSIPVIAEQAAARHRVPAHAELLASRRATARSTARIGAGGRRTIRSCAGSAREEIAQRHRDGDPRQGRARRRRRRSARARYEARWERGGLAFMTRLQRSDARQVRATTPPPSSCATRSAAIVEDPTVAESCCRRRAIRSAPSASASTPTTTRRSTGRTSRWSTSARRRSREVTPRPASRRASRVRARRDRVRDRLRRHDRRARQGRHPRRRRLTLNGQMGARARRPISA